MDKRAVLKLIGVGVGIYGIYLALLLPAMLVGPVEPVLLACVTVEAAAALVSAVGLWLSARWAPVAIIVLGAAIAATELIESAFIGIIALDRAVIVSVVAVLVAIAFAAYAAHPRRTTIAT